MAMDIKEKRMSLNMTQGDLAARINVSRTTVAMWETGAAMPRADKLPELAKILECDVSDLFDKVQRGDKYAERKAVIS